MPPPKLFELLEADEIDWVEILENASNVEASRYIHPLTQFTPLLLAVMAKDTSNNDARVAAIRSLLQSETNAVTVQCKENGYTPLMYACIATDFEFWDDVPVVKLLLEYVPSCFPIKSKSGHSALDLHIISMSRLQQQYGGRRRKSSTVTPRCTSLLKALTKFDVGISLTKSLDLLFSCNSLQVLEHVSQEEAQSFAGRLRDRRLQRKTNQRVPVPPGSRNFQHFWVWDFLEALLQSEHEHTYKDIKPVPPFNLTHTASQVKDFPLAFFMLCMRAYPAQIRTLSIVHANLPVHSVAAWDASDSMVARKSMTLMELVYEHPSACNYRNRQGKTPLSLALATRTCWDS
jgi:hypothetical protein